MQTGLVERLTDLAISGFLWTFRIAVVALVVVGSALTLASGKYEPRTWIFLLETGLILGSMYSLIALGYTMVYGILNLINFAHGDVLMIGALTALSLIIFLQQAFPGMPGWLLFIAGVAIAIPVCIVVSLVIERVAYRPLRNAPRLAPLITAIGVSIVLQTVAMLIWGRNYMTFPPLLSQAPIEVLGATLTVTKLLIILLSAVIMVLLLSRMVATGDGGRARLRPYGTRMSLPA